jgi:hypothetical protein
MAKVEKIIVQYGRTVQIKQFEPIRADLGVEVTLGPDDDAQEQITKAYMGLRQRVHELLNVDFEAHGLKKQ